MRPTTPLAAVALAAGLLSPAAAHAVPTVQTHTTISSPVPVGAKLVPLGDVNGDGLEDLGITDGYCATRVWVVFGATSAASVNLSSLGARGLVLAGLGTGGCRFEVSAAGDVNGDGRDDVAIGGYGTQDTIRVVYGRATGGTLDVRTVGANGWQLTVGTPETELSAVRGVGDVTGDGRDDLAIDYSTPGPVSGRHEAASVIVYGAAGARAFDPVTTTVPALRVGTSTGADDATLATLPFGDLTKDGKADVLTSLTPTFPSTGPRLDLHAGRSGSATLDLAALNSSSLALGELPLGLRIDQDTPVLGDLDGDGYQDYQATEGSPRYAVLSSKLEAPITRAKLEAASLRFANVTSLLGPDLAPAGDVTGDGRADLAAPATSFPAWEGNLTGTDWLAAEPTPRRWSFLVPGTTAGRFVNLAAPEGGTARLDSMPDGYVAETGLAFAGRPGQVVSVSTDRRSVLVQRVVDLPTPADTTAPVFTGVTLDNPTIWRSIPCGSEGGAACPGPRTGTLRFTVSERAKVRVRLVDAGGTSKIGQTVWVNAGQHALGVKAAYRWPRTFSNQWDNYRLTPGTYRFVLDATDLAGRKAATSTTSLTVTG
ncbi:MAG: VCBS repeat-containing protein [Solirubrobacteraceae bacterium]|nr:VCBS repeat-containing protein [Solirubrobacteraceae bacterium]